MMEKSGLPQAVLSQKLGEAIGERRVQSAVFTTFSFDPGFFELQVLPLLFHQSFSQVDKVRLMQLEDALREVDHMAVYYDRAALSQDAEPARLDYRRIDVRRTTGAFHPKLALLLLANSDGSDSSEEENFSHQSLLVACLSANLTRAGWWENLECAHIEEIADRDNAPKPVSFRRDLLAILRNIRGCASPTDNHDALDIVHEFLRDRTVTKQLRNARARGRWRTRMFTGQGRSSLAQWLAELRFDEGWNLEVISPYFDGKGSAPLKRMIETLRPQETRVLLPRDEIEGRALMTEDAYTSTAKLEGVRWAALSDQITRRSVGRSKDLTTLRRLHAKVYRLWDANGRDVVISGSVNCTSAAHSHSSAGNLEAAFLVDISSLKLPRRWWLSPLEQPAKYFEDEAGNEADGLDHLAFNVSLRYHWGDRTLEAKVTDADSGRFDVTDISGRHLFSREHAGEPDWQSCDRDAAEGVRNSLKSSSFVVVHCGDNYWRILVREEGMAHRPSILSDLTPEEILEYWSLLSAEERANFLERHGALGQEVEGPPTEKQDLLKADKTLFDRFAGVFHAFGCLHRHIKDALEDERSEDAEMRLLGAKYDSMPELLRKSLQREDGDPVIRYVTFLTAKQLRDSLKSRYPSFFESRRHLVEILDWLISDGIARRTEIFPDDYDQSRAFLNWFEPAFLDDLSGL